MTSIRGGGPSVSTNSSASEREDLLEILKDKGRRHHLASVVTKRTLAEQIREIRLARGWTQSDLARAAGKVQETISQLENPDYGSYTMKTLQRLAEAFDVTLTVRFDPFSDLIHRITHLSPEDLAVPDYEHDPGLHMIGAHIAVKRTANSLPLIRESTAEPNVRYLPLPAKSENYVIDPGYSESKLNRSADESYMVSSTGYVGFTWASV